jgi:hypothetical protein
MKFFRSVADSLILLLPGLSWSFCIIRRRLNTRPIMQKRKCDKNWVLCWIRMLGGECDIDSMADHLLFYRSLSSPPHYPLQMQRRRWMLITESRKSRRWSTGWNRKLYHDSISFPSESVWRSAVIVQLIVDRAAFVYHCISIKQASGIRTSKILYFTVRSYNTRTWSSGTWCFCTWWEKKNCTVTCLIK